MRQRALKTQIHIMGWLFISPILLGSIVFSFTPVLYSLIISFTEWNAVTPASFIGLDNYGLILGGDPYFLQAVMNTVIFTLGSIFFSIFFGLMLALLTNQKILGKNFYRTAFFAPSVTSTIAIGIIFSFIYEPNMGLLNSVLYMLGIQGPDWLGNSRFALTSVIIVQVWAHAGYNMVIYLAGLQGIPQSYYESAKIDGASRFHQFWHITLPMLSPTTFFLMITSFIGSFQVFNLIYVMTEGGPGYATTVYIHYLYIKAFEHFQMGYASAMAWVLFVVIGLITVFQWKMQKRWVHYQ